MQSMPSVQMMKTYILLHSYPRNDACVFIDLYSPIPGYFSSNEFNFFPCSSEAFLGKGQGHLMG